MVPNLNLGPPALLIFCLLLLGPQNDIFTGAASGNTHILTPSEQNPPSAPNVVQPSPSSHSPALSSPSPRPAGAPVPPVAPASIGKNGTSTGANHPSTGSSSGRRCKQRVKRQEASSVVKRSSSVASLHRRHARHLF